MALLTTMAKKSFPVTVYLRDDRPAEVNIIARSAREAQRRARDLYPHMTSCRVGRPTRDLEGTRCRP